MAVKTISGSSLILQMDQSDNPGSPSYVTIGGSTSCTLNVSQEAIDTTNKDSGGRKAFINGVSSWTLDCEALFTDGSSDGETIRPSTLYAALDGGYRIAVNFKCDTGQTGAYEYGGYGYITSLSANAAISEWSTYSISIQGDGELVDAAV
jgi:predicted secreted protein